MSSAVISTSAAQGRFFILDAEVDSGFCCHPERSRFSGEAKDLLANHLAGQNPTIPRIHPQLTIKNHQSTILSNVVPASRLEVRPAPAMVTSGIVEIDALAGGLPRGCLTEICGPASSGRTTLLLAALAAAIRRGEFCALVDASDALDAPSLAACSADLKRLLWVRCGDHSPRRHPEGSRSSGGAKDLTTIEKFSNEQRLEQLLRATDLLLESGGFGMIALDLCDLPTQTARKIPLTTWFRFHRAVEHTPTVLLVIERQSIAGSCSSFLIKLGATKLSAVRNHIQHSESQVSRPAHAQLFAGLEISAEIVRSRLERKPAASVSATFSSKAAWAG
jgi:hypothetical protein